MKQIILCVLLALATYGCVSTDTMPVPTNQVRIVEVSGNVSSLISDSVEVSGKGCIVSEVGKVDENIKVYFIGDNCSVYVNEKEEFGF